MKTPPTTTSTTDTRDGRSATSNVAQNTDTVILINAGQVCRDLVEAKELRQALEEVYWYDHYKRFLVPMRTENASKEDRIANWHKHASTRKQVLRLAKRIEATHPKAELENSSDVLQNGKVSAIRWYFGQAWDSFTVQVNRARPATPDGTLRPASEVYAAFVEFEDRFWLQIHKGVLEAVSTGEFSLTDENHPNYIGPAIQRAAKTHAQRIEASYPAARLQWTRRDLGKLSVLRWLCGEDLDYFGGTIEHPGCTHFMTPEEAAAMGSMMVLEGGAQ